MRFGITILPEDPWSVTEPRWRAAEQLGFDHAWTYDHLTWGGLPDAPWFAATPVLAAAAAATSRIGLGYFVASPNFRHPASFLRELLAVDDISGGRLLVGLGKGGDVDARQLGDDLSLKQRSQRFAEFVELLDRLSVTDDVSGDGDWYRCAHVRNRPGFVQQPRAPFVIAANGPRAMRLAVRFGQGWVTTGPSGADTDEEWWSGLGELVERFESTCRDADVDPAAMPRYLNMDAGPRFSLSSAAAFNEMTQQAATLGFTDVITHWPRTPGDGVYEGTEETLREVAADVLPRWRDS